MIKRAIKKMTRRVISTKITKKTRKEITRTTKMRMRCTPRTKTRSMVKVMKSRSPARRRSKMPNTLLASLKLLTLRQQLQLKSTTTKKRFSTASK